MNFIKIYSVSAALSGTDEYPHTLGIGSPEERSKSIVATSLATVKYLGIVTRYGICATIWKPSSIVMMKVVILAGLTAGIQYRIFKFGDTIDTLTT